MKIAALDLSPRIEAWLYLGARGRILITHFSVLSLSCNSMRLVNVSSSLALWRPTDSSPPGLFLVSFWRFLLSVDTLQLSDPAPRGLRGDDDGCLGESPLGVLPHSRRRVLANSVGPSIWDRPSSERMNGRLAAGHFRVDADRACGVDERLAHAATSFASSRRRLASSIRCSSAYSSTP